MKKMKLVVAGAAMLSSGAALADVSANVGVVSEYLFRGIEQTGGAAVQGGLDYSNASGFYLGTWGSTIGFATATGSGAEIDVYAGFKGSAGSVGYDLGAIYYLYTEEDEGGANPDPSNNTFEIYGKASFGPATVGLYYSLDDYFAVTDDAVMYPFLDVSFPLSKKVNLDLHAGQQTFDDDTIEDVLDYSIGVSAKSDSGVSAAFKLVNTDRELAPGEDDKIKAVISAGYSFGL